MPAAAAAGAALDVDDAELDAALGLDSTAVSTRARASGRWAGGTDGCAVGVTTVGVNDGSGDGATARGAAAATATAAAGAALSLVDVADDGALGAEVVAATAFEAIAFDDDADATTRVAGEATASADADCHPPSGR
jgi:hypothetical protein